MKSSLLILALSVALVPLSSSGPVTAVDEDSINVRALPTMAFLFPTNHAFVQTHYPHLEPPRGLSLYSYSKHLLYLPYFCIVALNCTFLKALNLSAPEGNF